MKKASIQSFPQRKSNTNTMCVPQRVDLDPYQDQKGSPNSEGRSALRVLLFTCAFRPAGSDERATKDRPVLEEVKVEDVSPNVSKRELRIVQVIASPHCPPHGDCAVQVESQGLLTMVLRKTDSTCTGFVIKEVSVVASKCRKGPTDQKRELRNVPTTSTHCHSSL